MTTQQMLDERYGRRRSPRAGRAGWITVGAVAVIATAALSWTTVSTALSSIDADVTSFDPITDAHSVTLTFQVVAPEGAAISCALEAQDEEHGVVGWKVVEYPMDGGRTQAFTETIPTIAAATTGLVNACWVI